MTERAEKGPPTRPVHVLRAIAVVLNTLVFATSVILVCLFERDGKAGWAIARGWFRVLLWIGNCRVHVRGLEHLDPKRQYVFMSNHRSNADIVALGWALRQYQLRWVAKKELLRVPLFGWGLRALKNIIIDRSNKEQAIESYRRARERISRGISVIVYPEGTRGTGDTLLPFKKGGFVFAMETGTPIVPIGIRGTADVIARKSWKIESGDVEVVVGEPIEVSEYAPDDKDRLIEDVRREIQALMLPGPVAPAERKTAAGSP